jgi:hypothetical protein
MATRCQNSDFSAVSVRIVQRKRLNVRAGPIGTAERRRLKVILLEGSSIRRCIRIIKIAPWVLSSIFVVDRNGRIDELSRKKSIWCCWLSKLPRKSQTVTQHNPSAYNIRVLFRLFELNSGTEYVCWGNVGMSVAIFSSKAESRATHLMLPQIWSGVHGWFHKCRALRQRTHES